jgi:hypothetical protein
MHNRGTVEKHVRGYGSKLVLVAEFTSYSVPNAKWTFHNEDFVSNENVEFSRL